MTYIALAQIDTFSPVKAAAESTGNTTSPTPREENNDCFAGVILVRTTNDPAKTIADLRAAVAEVDPQLAAPPDHHDPRSGFQASSPMRN